MIAAPGKARGQGCPRVVEFLDLYPTLADLCGLPAPPGVEGRSFAPLVADPQAPWDHVAYTILAVLGQPRGLAVTSERWRYLEQTDGAIELYDRLTDSREWIDLANLPAHAADLAAMRKLADAYRQQYRNQP